MRTRGASIRKHIGLKYVFTRDLFVLESPRFHPGKLRRRRKSSPLAKVCFASSGVRRTCFLNAAAENSANDRRPQDGIARLVLLDLSLGGGRRRSRLLRRWDPSHRVALGSTTTKVTWAPTKPICGNLGPRRADYLPARRTPSSSSFS